MEDFWAERLHAESIINKAVSRDIRFMRILL